MDTPKQSTEQVDISSGDSSSDNDSEPQIKRLRTVAEIAEPVNGLASEHTVPLGMFDKIETSEVSFSETEALLREAQIYQEYMQQLLIPTKRGSVIPFTSWTDLATSIKQLYKQPLHYLTNIHLRQLDQLRIGAPDEDLPLDSLVPPPKAEASIWLMEEFHRLSSSPLHLAKLWLRDRMYRVHIDPFSISLEQPGPSSGIVVLERE